MLAARILAPALALALFPLIATASTRPPAPLEAGELIDVPGNADRTLFGAAAGDLLTWTWQPSHMLRPGPEWLFDALFRGARRYGGTGGVVVGPSGYYKIVLEGTVPGASGPEARSGGGSSRRPEGPGASSRRGFGGGGGGGGGFGSLPQLSGGSSAGAGEDTTPSDGDPSSPGVVPLPPGLLLLASSAAALAGLRRRRR